ncbi:MAG: DUF2254 family protein, partial [Pseudomonadota bacterium]
MQDRAVQVSLGILLATFVFALTILHGIRSAENDFEYAPALSMTVAVGLALLSVMTLIDFVHHIPEHLSRENVTARLGRAMLVAINGLPRAEDRSPAEAGQGPCDGVPVFL